MVMMRDYQRMNYLGAREPYFNWYQKTKANADDLDALLKVGSGEDAVAFMDDHEPLFSSGIKSRVKRPSEMDHDLIYSMAADVINTVALMRFAVDTHKLAAGKATFREIKDAGYKPYFLTDTLEHTLQMNATSLDEAESAGFASDFILAAMDGFEFGTNHSICIHQVALHKASKHVTADMFDDINRGMFGEHGDQDDDYDYLVFRGISTSEGESDEAYRQALLNMVNNLFCFTLSGVKVEPVGMELAFSAKDYYSYLWYVLFERLTAGEVRNCKACGKLFIANLAETNERGLSQKRYCDGSCRTAGSRARNAIGFMKDGLSSEEAAAQAHVRHDKLLRYMELNPEECEGVNNG